LGGQCGDAAGGVARAIAQFGGAFGYQSFSLGSGRQGRQGQAQRCGQ
jgi:hypothetical protein